MSQIIADKISKTNRLFRVKWKAIHKNGATWEPEAHLIGDQAQTALAEYISAKEAAEDEAKKKKAAMLAGQLVETGAEQAAAAPEVEGFDKSEQDPKKKAVRLNGSAVWQYYGQWYWDNKSAPARKVADCKLCGKGVSASSTSNLKAHLASAHAKKMVTDLASDEAVGLVEVLDEKAVNISQVKVDAYTGAKKRTLDEVTCCFVVPEFMIMW